jgi:dihydroorotate dehydrogenase (NAD+) catalytic subunit
VKPDMKVSFAGLDLVNPVIAASGTFGYGIEFEEIVSLERIGGFVTKGISLEPIAGHACAAHRADRGRHVERHRPAERRRR